MKVKVLLFVLVVIGMSACTQKICPTYAKQDAPKTEKPASVRF